MRNFHFVVKLYVRKLSLMSRYKNDFFLAMRETHRYDAVVYHVDQLHKVLGRARARREQLPRGIVEQSCGYVVGFVR